MCRERRLTGLYRKVHVPGPVEFEPGRSNTHESEWFEPGNLGFPIYDVGPAHVGTLVCHDRHFPESRRSLGAGRRRGRRAVRELATYWPVWWRDAWDLICRLRAYENVLFLVAADKAGYEHGVDYVGRSYIVSLLGGILAQAESLTDEAVVATVDLDQITSERARRWYLADRQARPVSAGRARARGRERELS